MQKSASTGSLVAAGVQTLSHIPKRAVQHACYLPSWEVAPTDLKPGQTSLTRQVYAEEAKPLAETYVNPDRPAESNYVESTSKLLSPEAYKNPVRPVRQKEPPAGFGHHNCAHWKSTQHAFHDQNSIAGAVYHRQHGPSYQAANPPTCVSAATAESTFAEFHGRYGSNPRDKVHPEAQRMSIFKNSLTPGTHKGTNHIPGYQGHLPMQTRNPHVARVASGATLRSVDKTNLTQQFHVNVLSYSGHQPTHPMNYRGAVKTNTETMFGRSFTAPKLNAFD